MFLTDSNLTVGKKTAKLKLNSDQLNSVQFIDTVHSIYTMYHDLMGIK